MLFNPTNNLFMWHYEIGEIIISKEGCRKPERYQDIIIILGENGIMPKEFSKKFSLAAGLRNILVHRYTEIDIEEI
ncbi:DUF86 domain-containing protein, partial [bacterium]|nr:DUF86 domain-containing protein [bacterium]